ARFAQIQADIPSIVPVVTDETGATRDDVQVKMDGEILTSRLDGRALPVEPGNHDFSFEVGGLAVSQKILMMEGQRNRQIAISLAKRAPQKNLLAASTTTSSQGVTNLEPTTSETPAPEKRAPRRPAAETPPPSDEAPAADEPKPKGGGPGFVPYLVG